MASLEVTWTRALVGEDAAAYDRFVDDAPSGAYAQARAFTPAALAGRRFSPRWFLARREGRVVGAALVLRVLAFAVVERGPVTASLDDLPAVLDALRRTTRARGIARLQVMPYWADDDADRAEAILRDARFRLVHAFDSAHARTLRIDLRGKDAASLFAGKQGESIRRKVRHAEKAGASGRRGTAADLPALARLYGDLMQAQGRGTKPPAFFDALRPIIDEGRRGAIFVTEHDGEIVSALYASRHGRIATFMMGAASTAERAFSKMAPAMAAAIRWAHAEGCEAFDMGGIPMEGDPDEKRRSIAQFKHDFAKTRVRLVREHARWL